MSHDLGIAPQACQLVFLDSRVFLGLIAARASHTRMSRISISTSNFAEHRPSALMDPMLLIAINKAVRAFTEKNLLISSTNNRELCFKQSCMNPSGIIAWYSHGPFQRSETLTSRGWTVDRLYSYLIVLKLIPIAVAVTMVSL